MTTTKENLSRLERSGEQIYRQAGAVDLGQLHQFQLHPNLRFPTYSGFKKVLRLNHDIIGQNSILDAFWFGKSTVFLRPDFYGQINLLEHAVIVDNESQRLALLEIRVQDPKTARTRRQLLVFRLGNTVLKSIYDPSLKENGVDYQFRVSNEGAIIKLGILMCNINEFLAQTGVEGYASTTQFMAEALQTCLDI